jgi:hypothetical protein
MNPTERAGRSVRWQKKCPIFFSGDGAPAQGLRACLIDPETKAVAEIVGGPLTTGASPNDPGNATMPQR